MKPAQHLYRPRSQRKACALTYFFRRSAQRFFAASLIFRRASLLILRRFLGTISELEATWEPALLDGLPPIPLSAIRAEIAQSILSRSTAVHSKSLPCSIC